MSNKFDEPDEAEKLRHVLGRMVCCKHCMGSQSSADHMLKERAEILGARRFTKLRQDEHGEIMIIRSRLMSELVSLKEMKQKPEVVARIKNVQDDLNTLEPRFKTGEAFARAKRSPPAEIEEQEFFIPVTIEWGKEWIHESKEELKACNGILWKKLFNDALKTT